MLCFIFGFSFSLVSNGKFLKQILNLANSIFVIEYIKMVLFLNIRSGSATPWSALDILKKESHKTINIIPYFYKNFSLALSEKALKQTMKYSKFNICYAIHKNAVLFIVINIVINT